MNQQHPQATIYFKPVKEKKNVTFLNLHSHEMVLC